MKILQWKVKILLLKNDYVQTKEGGKLRESMDNQGKQGDIKEKQVKSE